MRATMRMLLKLTMYFAFVVHLVASQQNDCGNTSFSGMSDGVVTSPNFPLPYPHNLSCTYSIDVGGNNSVSLKFVEFDLELPPDGENCTRDWLMISCNETDDENLEFEKRYCGTDLPKTSLRFFNCPVVLLEFFADSSVGGGGFSIEYTVQENADFADYTAELDCGDTEFANSSSGLIMLPVNPTEYSAKVNCTYTISRNRSSTFSFRLLALQLPQLLDSFVDCNRDRIMIGCVAEGETELNPNTSNTYCRHSFDNNIAVPPNALLFYNCSTLKISIRSTDYNVQGANGLPFAVSDYDEDCGNGFFTGPTGTVTSPRFPLSRPHSLNCGYVLDVDRTKTVTLSFLSFNLEGTSRTPWTDICGSTWLTASCLLYRSATIFRSSSFLYPKYCGIKLKPLFLNYSNCDYLTISFVTNSTASQSGFQFRYTITSPGNTTPSTPDKESGNATFAGPNGFITSPGFPLPYPHHSDYVYSLEVDQTKTVGLYFYSFNVEGNSHASYMDDCHYDWLLITCSSSSMYYYYTYRQRARKYCGEKTTPLILTYSMCENLTLNFVSDSSLAGGGFKIWYSITSSVQSGCGNTSFSGPNGIVTSANFPLPYPLNPNCTYSIDAGRNRSVLLKFKHFELEAPTSTGYCANAWLMITCNETTTKHAYNGKKYCGAVQWTSSMRFVDCISLELEFFSGPSSVRGPRFMIEYTVTENDNSTTDDSELDCGVTMFTDSSGVLNLPANPKNYLATVNCTYTISINQTSVIWLNASLTPTTKFLQSFQDCDRESLKVGCLSEGMTEPSPSTVRVFCNRGRETSYMYVISPPSPLAFADCRTLQLSIRSTTYDNRETFSIPFKAYEPSDVCGNTSFSDLTGTISTLPLPFRYPKRVSCLYTIDSAHVNSFAFSIDRINLQQGYYHSRSCDDTWLTITCLVNGTPMAHPLANRNLCVSGSTYSTTGIFPACEIVFFNFSSNSTSADNGLTIRYRMGDLDLDCGTTLFTNSTGFINLPKNPSNSLATVNCTYTIPTNNSLSYIYLNTYFHSDMQFFRSFQTCDQENMTISCDSEGETEQRDRTTTKVLCRQSGFWHSSLLFADCRTLKLSIRSKTYDYRETFRIPFTVVRPGDACGQTSFQTPTGVISTRQFSFRYSRSVNCLYTIDGGNVTSVAFSLDRLQTQSYGGQCGSTWLTITCLVNGTSMAHPMADRKLCQNTYYSSVAAIFPACRIVFLNFSSDYIYYDRGFSLRYRMGDYDLDCGATVFTNASGVISFPLNPTDFPATVNCTYTISANRLSHIWLNPYPNSWTSVFRSFQDCSRESLTIGCVSDEGTEVNPNTTKAFCGPSASLGYRSENRFVFIDCPTLKLSIRSNTYYRQTFSVTFFVFGPSELCGNTSFSAQTGIISSPQVPHGYPTVINCLYVIESDHVNSVVLSVNRLLLSANNVRDGSCDVSWLTMSCLVNGTSIVHPMADRKLCGNLNPIVVRFPACRSVLLNFSSNYPVSETGFNIRYRLGDYDPECGNTSFSGPYGFIASPQFPLHYPHNLNCLYSIIGGPKSVILLSFVSFRLSGYSRPPYVDSCYGDSLSMSCLSDERVFANASSSRQYCGIKATPLRFSFSGCSVVVLNFVTSYYSTNEGFKVAYVVRDADLLCGTTVYGPPSGVISFPWNATGDGDSFECKYSINDTEPSLISLTIWSVSLQNISGRNCLRDWLFITCIDGQTAMNLNISHKSCEFLNSSLQLKFPECRTVQVSFHRDTEPTGKTFRIEYTVTSNGGNVSTTDLPPKTSVSATMPLGTDKTCATGCKLSSDSINCVCQPETSRTAAISVSTESPVTQGTKCEVGCEISTDGTTCDCSTTHSGGAVVNTQMNLSSQRGHAVGISLTVILLVAGAICLAAFLLFRRRRQKNRSEMLLPTPEEERAQMELEGDSTKGGSLFGARRKRDRDASKYLQLRPMSTSDHDEPSSKSNSAQNLNQLQPDSGYFFARKDGDTSKYRLLTPISSSDYQEPPSSKGSVQTDNDIQEGL